MSSILCSSIGNGTVFGTRLGAWRQPHFSPQKRFTARKTRIHLDSCRTWKESRQHAGTHRPRATSSILEHLNEATQSPLGHKLCTVFVPLLPLWDPSSTVTKSKENQGLP